MADPARQPRPKRRRDDGYELRVESITYLGDDPAAARAIENFLRLSRSRERQRAMELEPDRPDVEPGG
jgi:hypothetical protein